MNNKAAGFTLVELLVTIALASIVITLGVPSFQDVVKRNRVTSETNAFIGALSLARSEAVKRGVHVRVCNLGRPGMSDDGCSAGLHDSGVIIFADLNEDGDFQGSGADADEMINVLPEPPSSLALDGATAQSDSIAYTANGFLYIDSSGDSETVRTVEVYLEDAGSLVSSDYGRRIVVTPLGRPAVRCLRSGVEHACI